MFQENSKGIANDRSVPNDEIFDVVCDSQKIFLICVKYNVTSKNRTLTVSLPRFPSTHPNVLLKRWNFVLVGQS
jgi:hypothetical protein